MIIINTTRTRTYYNARDIGIKERQEKPSEKNEPHANTHRKVKINYIFVHLIYHKYTQSESKLGTEPSIRHKNEKTQGWMQKPIRIS
jgi:hypothetical protein